MLNEMLTPEEDSEDISEQNESETDEPEGVSNFSSAVKPVWLTD